ncbi:MAG: 2OG-Fe(II) oxygenase, partial [Tagaea sp.]|nr:2OG-Fe(II) oxygenase [Tagaea sp.]
MTPAQVFDFEKFAATPKAADPFEHAIVPGFVRQDALAAIDASWPEIGKPGSFPLSEVGPLEPAVTDFVAALESDAFREAIEAKFGLDLKPYPTLITFRDRCRARDGQIHTDSKDKVVTVLVYMNTRTGGWRDSGGKLRLLRGPETLENFTREIEPVDGNLLVFRCTRDAWHGHASYEGPRHVMQMNWLVDDAALRKNALRHRVSAFFKKLFG